MSISTGKGDGGESGLIGGSRVPKDDIRLETYGTIDELNAVIGVVRTAGPTAGVDTELERISGWLFSLGSDLATPGDDPERVHHLPDSVIAELDAWIHREEDSLPPLRRFILPGGARSAAHLHHARTVCRRAERHVVTLSRTSGEGKTGIVFLNRLSDLLFLYARRCNHEAGVADTEWEPE